MRYSFWALRKLEWKSASTLTEIKVAKHAFPAKNDSKSLPAQKAFIVLAD